MDLTPRHLDLGELIERLRAEPDQTRRVPIGFKHAHSYRGYYDELAFEIAEGVTVGEMLAAAESARGATFHGWKGGVYVMDVDTYVWLVQREGDLGETLGAVLLELLLDGTNARRWKTVKDTPAYQAGREDAARDIAEDLRTVLEQRQMHLHVRPGIWDDDNPPDRAGKSCVECAARDRLGAVVLDVADQVNQPRTVSEGDQGDNPGEQR